MRRLLFPLLALLTVTACHPTPRQGAGTPDSKPQGHVMQAPPSKGAKELREELASVKDMTADQLLSKRALPFTPKLSYEPSKALGLEKIRKSSLAPTPAEEARLAADGFVISDAKKVPEFTYGYTQIYGDHLPLYISADSILHAVHKSYDDGLAMLEDGALAGDVEQLLQLQRGQLKAPTGASPEAQADVDLFLAVGLSLLTGKAAPPVAGASAAEIQRLVEKAVGAQQTGTVKLFGVDREVDFSQFKPRGHYLGIPSREQYFRALIWFGRTEFRLIETTPKGASAVQHDYSGGDFISGLIT